MNDFIAKLTEMIALGMVRALCRPGIMTGLCHAWRAAMEPQQIMAAKPDRDDDAFVSEGNAEGWGAASPHDGLQP